MVWVQIDDATMDEADKMIVLGQGALVVRQTFTKNVKPIEFYGWLEVIE